MNKETYNALYQNIIDQTSDLMTSLSQENSHIHQEEARIVAQQTLDRLQNLQEKMQSNLTELQKNAEWDLFTIAFYGETNAGKSTLIETLRLLLKEKTKLEEHKKYDENEKLEATQTQKLEQTASRYKQLEKEKQDYIALFNKQYQKTAGFGIQYTRTASIFNREKHLEYPSFHYFSISPQEKRAAFINSAFTSTAGKK